MSRDVIEPWFVEAYKSDLYELLQRLSDEKVRTIIAIARKGPRLLEVIQREWPEEGSEILKKVISDKAIPFSVDRFNKQDDGTLIIDDILIFGSTYLDTVNVVHETSGHKPTGLIMALEYRTPKAKTTLRSIPSIRKIEENETTVFSVQLVEAFYPLNKPFDIEHPIIELPLRLRKEKNIEDILLKSNLNFCNLTSPFQRKNDVLYFSVDIPRTFWLPLDEIIEHTSIEIETTKCRLYINPQNKTVKFMPLALFSMSADEIAKGPIFTENFDAMNTLILKARDMIGNSSQRDEAILRLVNFLIAYIQGVYFLQFSPIKPIFDDGSIEPNLNPFDLQVLFGFNFGNYLYRALNDDFKCIFNILSEEYYKEPIKDLKILAAKSQNQYAEDLLSECKSELKVKTLKDLSPYADEPYSILKTIFAALLYGKDKPEREENIYMRNRLKFGFSFEDLLWIMKKEFNYVCDPFWVSTTLDYYIDRGTVIPIFIRVNGEWRRVFRFGESFPNADKVGSLVKILLEITKSRINKDLGSTDFEKMLTLIHKAFSKKTELGYVVHPDIFGERPFIEIKYDKDHKKEVDLLTWAEKERVIIIQPTKRENYVKIHPNLNKYPPRNPWDTGIGDEIKSLINFYLDAVNLSLENITKDELRLALTTCYDEDNTIKAIRAELTSWFEEPDPKRVNFMRIIESLREHLIKFQMELITGEISEDNKKEAKKIYDDLGQVDLHIKEAHKKRVTFKKLEDIKEKLDLTYSFYSNYDSKAYLAATYRTHVRRFISSDTYDKNRMTWRNIQKLLVLCHILTSLARTFISNKNLGISESGRKVSTEIDRYNTFILKYLSEPIGSDFKFKAIDDNERGELLDENLGDSVTSFLNLLEELYYNLYECYEKRVKDVKSQSDLELSNAQMTELLEGTDIHEDIFKIVLNLASEISEEGREGKKIGTAFVLGDSDNVLQKSVDHVKPNPYEGAKPEDKRITDETLWESIKEYAQFDGFFVIRSDGVIEAAGRFSTVDSSRVILPAGLGGRHRAVAAITSETKAVGVLVSQSGGKIKLFKNGKIVAAQEEKWG